MKFCDKLIELRKKNGYSQEKLSELLGVSRQSVSRWEIGDTTPEMSILIKICNVFNVSADYLIKDEIEKENDIPCIKIKEEEIKAINIRKNQWRLISLICFFNGAFFTALGIILADNCIQRIISGVGFTVLFFVFTFQFIVYIKNRQH